jgi:hypothetical protein
MRQAENKQKTAQIERLKRNAKPNVSPAEFAGTQMANFLELLSKQSYIPEWYRRDAKKLYERWDSICSFRLNNPIVASELEKELFPNG